MKIRNFYKLPMLRRIKRREGTVPLKKAPTRRKNARNYRGENNSEKKRHRAIMVGEKEKVEKKEKRKEV